MSKINIHTVKQKYEEQLMRYPNVLGVGIGEKEGVVVIKVFVSVKVPEAELKENQIVPKMLDGFKTDVEEIGVITAQI